METPKKRKLNEFSEISQAEIVEIETDWKFYLKHSNSNIKQTPAEMLNFLNFRVRLFANRKFNPF
jgi:hypothetical protein